LQAAAQRGKLFEDYDVVGRHESGKRLLP
jgi:hypothetical protein